MAESTLSVSYADLRLIIADEIGLGLDSSKWPTDEATRIDLLLKSALRQVYQPSGAPPGFTWSFLTLGTTLDTSDAAEYYNLPADFASFVTERLPFDDASLGYPAVQLKDVLEYQRLREGCLGVKFRPRWGALLGAMVDDEGTKYFRRALGLLPIPDAVYKLQYFYRPLPDFISATLYPYGGMNVSELLIASCRDVVEQRMKGGMGDRHLLFQQQLVAAINDDIVGRPSQIGRNFDPSVRQPETQVRIADTFKVGGEEVS